jgi:signal transduction histidine kinase
MLDAYDLLQFYFAKLETRSTTEEVYAFLLEFVRSSVGKHQINSPGCIYLIDQSDMSLYISNYAPDTAPVTLFENELNDLISTGLIAWCIRNRRMTFVPNTDKQNGSFLLFPLYTNEHMLGLILVHTDSKETELPREIIQVITLASMQTATYVENTRIYRTLQDTQSRMIHAEKLSAIGQIAASVAHEINNPVGYVKGNSEMLKNYLATINTILLQYQQVCTDPSIETLRKKLDIDFVINEMNDLTAANILGLNRIADIVANLKSFARPDQKEQFESADIEEIIKIILKVANNELKYSAEVVTRFSKVTQVMCNTGQMNQVFLNLIINAAQATRELEKPKNGTIAIETSEDTSNIYVRVTDNGPGIEKHELLKIFEPFFTTKPAGKGTGLGLSITLDIIKKHQGKITVTSEKGIGTTFTVMLPKIQTDISSIEP